ncbi:MAG: HD-GYP domain-containing protein, partial [Candidatus Limnocylindrales bacterium]
AASLIVLAATLLVFPLPADPQLLIFWTGAALLSSAAPVRLPRGTRVSVSGSAIMASAFLAGPAVAGIVAAIGSTEWREVRGHVPWYGSLYNHAVVVIPAIAGAIAYRLLAGDDGFDANPATLLAAVVAGVTYLALNSALSAAALAVRDGLTLRSIFQGDWSIIAASMLALSPLAWLMATVTVSVGAWAVLLFGLPLATTRGAYARVVEIRDMFTQTIRSLSAAVDKKDKFTSGHSQRVQEISVEIGRQMRCSESELEALEWGALLHDIGKIGVPDAVLLKPDKLNREERTIMNMHPVLGEEIIQPVTRLAPELPLIRHHHEWYNGSGYPDHLLGQGIPKLARILHVADAFEAMTAARPYRMTPLTSEQAMGELRKFSGIQFDPQMVDAFARTRYVADVPDAGRPTLAQPIPLLSQVATMRAANAEGATPKPG